MLKDIGLVEKKDALASTLSGGQKRKLSVGIALIAGSKVYFLPIMIHNVHTSLCGIMVFEQWILSISFSVAIAPLPVNSIA